MSLIEAFYKNKQIRCPSCNNMIYPGDCDIRSTADPVEMPPDLVPRNVTSTPVPPVPGTTLQRNLVQIQKHTLLKRAPRGNTYERGRARMNPEPLDREFYTRCEARRVCHICGYFLPINYDSVRSRTIAIVGDTSSGKSLYISALIKQLQSKRFLRADQGLTFNCLTPDVEDYYIKEYFQPLFDHKRRLPPSQLFQETTHTPLIYELSMKPTDDRPVRTLNLVIYDTASEDYMVQQRLVQYASYALSADAIIFLADPMSMPSIYNNLPSSLNSGSMSMRTANSGLEKMIASVKSFKGAENFRATPIAVTVSKADLLKYMVPLSGQYYFMFPHEYTGNVRLSELERIDAEVRDFIRRFGDRPLLHTAAFFKKVKFFATSATGYAPDANGVFPNVVPQRCLDPFLWILYELKILPKDEPF